MEKQTQTTGNDTGALAEAGRPLMEASVAVTRERTVRNPERPVPAPENREGFYWRFRGNAIESAGDMDMAGSEHASHAIGIAFGVEAVIGCLVAHRRSTNGD